MTANYRIGGENYGIDVRQGYFTFDYGITEKWAADLNIGATTVGWRPFDSGNIAENHRRHGPDLRCPVSDFQRNQQ